MGAEPRAARGGPVLVELIGLAGAGKTTVFESLLGRRGWIERRPVLGTPAHAPLAGLHVVSVLFTLARRRALRRPSWQDVKLMTYVQAVPDVLARRGADGRAIVFDQGPIYLLSRRQMQCDRLEGWRTRTFETWASLLDVVVWLDAPDAVLLERINDRPSSHALKGREPDEARRVLTRTRAVYAEALERLESARNGPIVLRFDTSREAVDEVVDHVLATLERLRSYGDRRAPAVAPSVPRSP